MMMMMTVENFLLFQIAMFTIGGFLLYRYGESKYERGILDGILMHHEGRLTYTTYQEDGVEMLDVQIQELEE